MGGASSLDLAARLTPGGFFTRLQCCDGVCADCVALGPVAVERVDNAIGDQADALGILVMVNGVVGNNNYRRLDRNEFRGFALVDARAPLVFINDADAKPALFTLGHALAHIWLGQSALSDATPITAPEHDVERWCSEVAAELLVPLNDLRAEYRRGLDLRDTLSRLGRRFR